MYLCPLCDQPIGPRREDWFNGLPQTSFETLPNLLRRIWSCTTSNPRESNDLGRKLSRKTRTNVTVSQVCEQHRYETLILPLAKQYLWPRASQFEALVSRIKEDDILQHAVDVYISPSMSVLLQTSRMAWKETRVVKEIVEQVTKVRETSSVCG